MSGEKTEKPTQKKLEDARKKGQVAVSKDAQTLVKLMAFYLFLFWICDSYKDRFTRLLDLILQTGLTEKHHFSESIFQLAFQTFALIAFPLVMVCAIASLLSTWMQIGILIAPEALTPSFKKMDAVSNVKNMFSKKSLIQLLISIVKVIILAIVGYLVFTGSLHEIVYSYRAGLPQLLNIAITVIKQMIFFSLAVFVVLAVIDWSVVYSQHIKSLKMSLQDIKDENKQSYGDPKMKSKRKQMHRSLLNSSLDSIRSAKAVVANPTHISVALDYEPGKHDIPYILAMGEDDEAMLMREEAKRHGVPVIVNVKLARMLYADCEENEYIRREHLELAAEVFKAVMQLAVEQKKPTIE